MTAVRDQRVHPGLRDVAIGETTISSIDALNGRLRYCGIDVAELAERSTYEEVVFLLWNGRLPTKHELDDFRQALLAQMTLPPEIVAFVRTLPKNVRPIDALRTAVSYAGMCRGEDGHDDRRDALRLTGLLPAVLAAIYRAGRGEEPIACRSDRSVAQNLLRMFFGRDASAEDARVVEALFILHADHGMSASAFAALVTAATLSDMYSAITSAVGALKGPLHGGANEGVITNLLEIGARENVGAWVDRKLAAGEKIMGFGHPVYKAYDPRARKLKSIAKRIAGSVGTASWVEMTEALEEAVWQRKRLFPNVDLYSASVYYTLGFAPEYFTPLFAAMRISGWTATILEYLRTNKLIRPGLVYAGPESVPYVPLEERA